MSTYKTVRHFASRYVSRHTITTGLTLKEAQERCRDPEASSSTCTKAPNKARTRKLGPWFDGYEKE